MLLAAFLHSHTCVSCVCVIRQASTHCADLLSLPGLVSLLVAASACFVSPSPAVVSATPKCIHVLTDAAKARAEERQQLETCKGSKSKSSLPRCIWGARKLASVHTTSSNGALAFLFPEAEVMDHPSKKNGKAPEGWLTTVKSLGAALGMLPDHEPSRRRADVERSQPVACIIMSVLPICSIRDQQTRFRTTRSYPHEQQ